MITGYKDVSYVAVRAVRMIFASASTIALIISIYVYVRSFTGMAMESLAGRPFDLHLSMFLVLIPICAFEFKGLRDQKALIGALKKARPKLIGPAIQMLFVFYFSNFMLFLILSHGAAPAIVNGNYVLNDHGRVKGVLSASEYFSLKSYELRLFASGWVLGYFSAAAYWWFPRANQELLSNEDT